MENTKKCCPKTCIISFIAVFAFLFGYDWLVHGHLLMADYEATASLWRPQEEMQQFFGYCIAYHAALAAVLVCFFKKFRSCKCGPTCQCNPEAASSCCPIKSGGLCFGIKVGLLMGLAHASNYIWLAIPGDLAVKWFIAYLVQGAGAGVILGMVCKSKSCSKGSCDMKGQ
ncbi:MAG: hypothetical protein SFX19_08755 [Alphaproteobacteria bacterium]|nr:hypothetical protein [Alphaproteobacteria bacterium]